MVALVSVGLPWCGVSEEGTVRGHEASFQLPLMVLVLPDFALDGSSHCCEWKVDVDMDLPEEHSLPEAEAQVRRHRGQGGEQHAQA